MTAHQASGLRYSTSARLYFVLGIDGFSRVVHPCTIENKEAERGIRSSELRDWNREYMAKGKGGIEIIVPS